MFNQIYKFIQKYNLIPENSKILLGLSGGPDSVFLLYYLKDLQNKINFELIAAYLDHEWRKESHKDAEFCKKLTSKLNIPFIESTASELNLKIKETGSKEELGRKMRRAFLEKAAKENKCDKIALAHHLQDQEETFFIRLIRGTSLSGLISMKPIDGIYIRPLLEINKNEILQYLEENKISFVIDPSNESFEFLRNRIRKKVLPSLTECDERFDDNFLRTLSNLKKTEQFLEKIVQEKFNEIIDPTNSTIQIDIKKLFELDKFLIPKIIVYWLIKSKVNFTLTEKFINEIIRFLEQAGSATHSIHHEWEIQKKKNLAQIIKK